MPPADPVTPAPVTAGEIRDWLGCTNDSRCEDNPHGWPVSMWCLNCQRRQRLPANPDAVLVSRERLEAALDRAWLRSGDARGMERPPDLAGHQWAAIAPQPEPAREGERP